MGQDELQRRERRKESGQRSLAIMMMMRVMMNEPEVREMNAREWKWDRIGDEVVGRGKDGCGCK